ncbi:MAG: FAD-binding oxidoreductase [Geminicoccaceae bacterium]|nr:FAD-binding oxidoreductase [Geminicoccaceae bacterium]
MRVIICGAGVVGACSAFELAKRGVETVVVERAAVACAASSGSGGFLARDWCDGTPLEALARRSYVRHAELVDELADEPADEPGENWGYRPVETLSVAAAEGAGRSASDAPDRPAWLDESCVVQGRLGTERDTAQVDPGAFTRAMMAAAQARGARLMIGRVEAVAPGRTPAVIVDGTHMTADAVVLALGPWSAIARTWLPIPAVFGLKGQSITFRAPQITTTHNLFVDYRFADGSTAQPEIIPRPDGTLYVCGLSHQTPVPLDPWAITPDADRLERLRRMALHVIPSLRDAEVLVERACFRPVTADGLPLIGPHADHERILLATGHSVWGILNAPATGEALAELLTTGETKSVPLAPFAPSRRTGTGR